MARYLDKVKELEQLRVTQVGGKETAIGASPEYGVPGVPDEGPPQQDMHCEISETSEKRAAILVRMRKGQSWLSDQHKRWKLGDTTAADDANFSKMWNAWWDLDYRLRADDGFLGCIHGPDRACSGEFPCQGCADLPAPTVVAQLELEAAMSDA